MMAAVEVNEWPVVTLGNVASVYSGGTPSRAVPAYWGGAIPWITTTEIDFGRISSARQTITEMGLERSAARIAPAGTVLLAMYGQGKTRGKSAILDIPASMNQACAAIETRSRLDAEYLLHYLTAHYSEIRAMSNSGSQENLSGELVRRIEILLPSIDEQRRIARALADADALTTSLEALNAKKRAIKQGMMQELLTGRTRLPGFAGAWRPATFGDVVRIQRGSVLTRAQAGQGRVPVVAGGKTPAGFTDRPNRGGRTITISASGASAGYVAKYNEPIFASDCSTISGANTYDLDFIYFCLVLRQEGIYKAQTGGAQPHIRARDVYPMGLQIPATIDEQRAIARALSDADDELEALERRLEATRAIKQGMMQELLTGRTRLVPTEVVA